MVESQHLPQLPHGQLSSGRHQSPSSLIEELMPESLTRKKRRQPTVKVTGFSGLGSTLNCPRRRPEKVIERA
jgi:hypothetical protein